ncbi:MAG: [Fe-Fe] hydrogenase large subunit C-terminal domain-containing protein [Polyangiaceae bacterium]|jgi:iron only hydrogenase large subunit-like protein/uncharacterized protein YoxC
MGSALRLAPLITTDREKCVNCHACIGACPVKFCNDASGDYVKVNGDMCIGCGACIPACSHQARSYRDDFDAFMDDLRSGAEMVAVVAPAVAAQFPGAHEHLNGWLKSLGIKACFDVSFGAELTVKSYIDHLQNNHPSAVIAQPCPAIVSFIEIYRPDLLPYLAPADSPMLHTIKMVRDFYKAFRNCRVAVISPCIAKRREFDDTVPDAYNVTMRRIDEYLKRMGIRLEDYPALDYDNPPAERAVLFSSPGGLLRTAMRWDPDIATHTRKIEGRHSIYDYLEHLRESVRRGTAPKLVDCLNCDLGCNGGPGTSNVGKSPDEVESLIEQRRRRMQERWQALVEPTDENPRGTEKKSKSPHPAVPTPGENHALQSTIEERWRPGLYGRDYADRSANNALRMPTSDELEDTYRRMGKLGERDYLNCDSCGYGSCQRMAIAIFNNLNRPEHCHQYQVRTVARMQLQQDEVKLIKDMSRTLAESSTTMTGISKELGSLAEGSMIRANASAQIADDIRKDVGTVSTSMSEMEKCIKDISRSAQNAAAVSEEASRSAALANETMAKLGRSNSEIGQILNTINEIAAQTKILALNATIEAARAGDSGKGFIVVAHEVKDLARQTAQATDDISQKIKSVQLDAGNAMGVIKVITEIINKVRALQTTIARAVEEQAATTTEMTRRISRVANGSVEITSAIGEMVDSNRTTQEHVDANHSSAQNLGRMAEDLNRLLSGLRLN